MSGRVGEDSDAPKGPHGGGAPTINGSIEASLTPELLFRMNKKIAQLTKVLRANLETVRKNHLHCCLPVCCCDVDARFGCSSSTRCGGSCFFGHAAEPKGGGREGRSDEVSTLGTSVTTYGDGETGRLLNARAGERSGDAVCHRVCMDERIGANVRRLRVMYK
ncbi:hypothetical protein E2C01_034562 [Portunus trituberculatus]|uniref:Uncharacterized protein n=1 Tax=Portunus trituberculatus TaxID=210409 RepID=A0A5B7F8U3_PORTR|nr:hypothetical protein [Portunus trituberculatus]